MALDNLDTRRIAVLAADGVEKMELVIPMAALKKAGARVDIISLRSGKIRAMNMLEPAGRIEVNFTINDVYSVDYDGLFIPGGYINPDLLRQSALVRKFVQEFDAQNKPIASLCHGPWVLASAGILAGRTLTSWPGIRDDLVNAGATWIDKDVVHDGNLMTSRTPQDLPAFSRAILGFYSHLPVKHRVLGNKLMSSPQANEPPEALLNMFKWLPPSSLKVVGGVAAGIALGTLAAVVSRAVNTIAHE